MKNFKNFTSKNKTIHAFIKTKDLNMDDFNSFVLKLESMLLNNELNSKSIKNIPITNMNELGVFYFIYNLDYDKNIKKSTEIFKLFEDNMFNFYTYNDEFFDFLSIENKNTKITTKDCVDLIKSLYKDETNNWKRISKKGSYLNIRFFENKDSHKEVFIVSKKDIFIKISDTSQTREKNNMVTDKNTSEIKIEFESVPYNQLINDLENLKKYKDSISGNTQRNKFILKHLIKSIKYIETAITLLKTPDTKLKKLKRKWFYYFDDMFENKDRIQICINNTGNIDDIYDEFNEELYSAMGEIIGPEEMEGVWSIKNKNKSKIKKYLKELGIKEIK